VSLTVAGVWPIVYHVPFPQPPSPLYHDDLARPGVATCYMVEINTDTPEVAKRREFPWVAGLFTPGLMQEIDIIRMRRMTRRFATRPFITGGADRPAYSPIEARLAAPPLIERAIEFDDEGRVLPIAMHAVGQLTLLNKDGALEILAEPALAEGRTLRLFVATGTLLEDGQTIDIKPSTEKSPIRTTTGAAVVGVGGFPIAMHRYQEAVLPSFQRIFEGVSEGLTFENDTVTVRVRDPRIKLQRSIQEVVYSGTGGLGGMPELEGVSLPYLFGRGNNVTPVLIDRGNWVYQFHAREARNVERVFDGAVPLGRYKTVDTWEDLIREKSAGVDDTSGFRVGTFIACHRLGLFRLSGRPEGKVTVNCRGDGVLTSESFGLTSGYAFARGVNIKPVSVRLHTGEAAAIAVRLLTDFSKLTEEEYNRSQMLAFNADNRYDVGFYLSAGGQMSVGDAVARLCSSMGAVMIRTADGRYQFRKLTEPLERASAWIKTEDVVENSLTREPPPYRQPWSVVEAEYGINWTTMTDEEIFDVVEEDGASLRGNLGVAFFTRKASTISVRDGRIAAAYPDRSRVKIETLLTRREDAQRIAQESLELNSLGRQRYTMAVKGFQYQLELGQTVNLRHQLFGLQEGKNLLVTGIAEDGPSDFTRLILFG
jgi:hypothetical protein